MRITVYDVLSYLAAGMTQEEILGIGGVAIGLPAQNIVAVLVAINDQIARNNRSDKGTGLANGKTKFSFD